MAPPADQRAPEYLERRIQAGHEIAGDIRSRRLAAGRPAPSTRAIVRDWNVAMATATKVIGALRTAGLVETIPGSGTIVRHRNEPAAVTTRIARLTQREIVETGVRIADADGLPFVTMRWVADSLGVSRARRRRRAASAGAENRTSANDSHQQCADWTREAFDVDDTAQ